MRRASVAVFVLVAVFGTDVDAQTGTPCKDVIAADSMPDLFDIARCGMRFAWGAGLVDQFESFAKERPQDKRSAVALVEAYEVRAILGEFAMARAHAESFARRWGKRKPKTAARLMLRIGEIYEQQGAPDMQAEVLRSSLANWGIKGGREQAIVAHFKLGEILWKESCPRETYYGACVEVEQPFERRARARGAAGVGPTEYRRRLPKPVVSCGWRGSLSFKVVTRDGRLAREAQHHFKEAVRLFAGLGAEPSADSDVAFAAAGSAFYLAEPTYERFLAVPLPTNLDFRKPERFYPRAIEAERTVRSRESERRLSAYLLQKEALAALLGKRRDTGLYHRAMAYDVPEWTVAALARIGQLSGQFAEQLLSVEISEALPEVDEWGAPRETYCDVWVEQAEPLGKTAVRDYERCVEASRQLSSWNEWTQLCEAELNRISPLDHPLLVEAIPEPASPMPLSPPALEPYCQRCR